MNSDETDPEINPSIENVLPEFKPRLDEKYSRLKSASQWAIREGARVSMMGGITVCPWCLGTLNENGQSMIVVCDKNPKHIVQWLYWGG